MIPSMASPDRKLGPLSADREVALFLGALEAWRAEPAECDVWSSLAATDRAIARLATLSRRAGLVASEGTP